MPGGQVFFWDTNRSATSTEWESERDHIVAYCKKHAKQWVFQMEQGEETGYLHFQIRINLKEKAVYPPKDDFFNKKWSRTSNAACGGKQKFNYVFKDETRVQGPWSDKDQRTFIPKDVPTELYYWQKKLLERAERVNDRQIIFVANPEGNVGKSKLVRWLYCHKQAIYVPPLMDTAQQMSGFVYAACTDNPVPRRWVVFDMPRAISESQWWRIGPMVELVKDGWAFDGRNNAKGEIITQPIVLVFYNKLPGKLELPMLVTPNKILMWTEFSKEEPTEPVYEPPQLRLASDSRLLGASL